MDDLLAADPVLTWTPEMTADVVSRVRTERRSRFACSGSRTPDPSSPSCHGTGAGKALPDPAAATVMMNADGSVNLVTAAADEGQGNRTVLAQIASETLGIEFEKISVIATGSHRPPTERDGTINLIGG